MTTLSELKKMRADYRKAIQETGKQALSLAVMKFMEENPTVAAIRWTGYTPSFNDGNPCIFGMDDLKVKLVGTAPMHDDDDDDDDEMSGFVSRYSVGYESDIGKALLVLTRDLDSDIVEQVFGNDHKVTITRDGEVTVEESGMDY